MPDRRCNQLLATLLSISLLAAGMLPHAAAAAGKNSSEANTSKFSKTGNATLNLKNADITNLIATVSQITGKNFVVDPRVKGKVTVISSSPMTPAGIYQAFLSILQVHGYAAIRSGQIIKIMPEVNAKQQGGAKLVTNKKEPPGDMITKVIKVNNVPAAQLVPVLRPLVPQYGHLAAYTPTNMLIISDRAANVERLTDIVQRLDHNKKQNIDVVALKNANASNLVNTLNKLLENPRNSKRGKGTQSTVIADERTNSLIIKGSKSQRARLRSLIMQLDKPTASNGGTQVVYLKYATAKDVAKVLKGYVEDKSSSESKQKQPSKGPIKVIPDNDVNALVITAPPDAMKDIKAVISQLDIRRGQIYVQAVIAELSISKARKLGVDFAAFNKSGGGVGSLQQNSPGSIAQAIQAGDAAGAATLLKQGTNAALGFVSGGTTFVALLNALYNDSKTNVLSTPSLVTMDNEEAKISVGKEVPFLTGSYSDTGLSGGGSSGVSGSVNPFQTIQRKNVGIELDITPQISQGHTVKLKVKAKVSSIANSNQNAVDLITNKRTLETTVSVDDGQILVLGGLIDSNTRQSKNRVPFLSSIPLIGNLFKFRSSNKDKRNLMLFIRPVIFYGKNKANYYTRKKYNYIRNLQLSGQGQHVPLMQHENIPVLAPMKAFGEEGTSQVPPPEDGSMNGNKPGGNTPAPRQPSQHFGSARNTGLFTPPGSTFDVSMPHQ